MNAHAALLEKDAAREHWQLRVEDDPGAPFAHARIAIADWRIELGVETSAPEHLARFLELDPPSADELWGLVLRALLAHEMGHWKWCPGDGLEAARILEGVARGLLPAPPGAGAPATARAAILVANVFEDWVVDTTNACWSGPALAYDEALGALALAELLRGENEGEKPPALGLALEAVKLRLAPYTGPFGQRLRREIGARSADVPGLPAAVDALVEAMVGDPGGLGSLEPGAIMDALHRRDDWPRKSERVAQILRPFLGLDPRRSEGAGAVRSPRAASEAAALEKPAEDIPTGLGARTDTGTGRRLSEVLEELAPKGAPGDARPSRARRGRGGSKPGSGEADASSIVLVPFEFVDGLYRARAVPFALDLPRSYSFTEYWVSSRRLGESEPIALPRVRWAGTRLLPDGPEGEFLEFAQRHVVVPRLTRAANRGAFPDLAFVADCSGSMGWDPLRGLGAYDILLRAVYSVLGRLAELGVAPYLRYAGVTFSTRTVSSGWCDWDALAQVKAALFSYQGEGTALDTSVLDALRTEARRPFMTFLVTDGAIAGVSGVVESIATSCRSGSRYVVIGIGSIARPFLDAAEQAGAEAHALDGPEALQDLVLGRTMREFGT